MQKTAAKMLAYALALPFVFVLPLGSAAAGFRDTLDTPAVTSRFAVNSLLNGLALAGKRVVAVGQRGHIVYSDDGGDSWQQARVPVASDLVAVSFPTREQGWAVGHDGVVLHSADAGTTWQRQLDGRSLGPLLVSYYETQAAKGALGNAEHSATFLDEVKRMAAHGAENAFLDVWFSDERTGYVVGAFNLILRTTDGGKNWEPMLHRTANPNRLHFYSVRQNEGQIYISGEQGLLMKLDTQSGRFVALDAGYRGTLFGTTGRGAAVLAFGLRGNAFRSADGGRSWMKVETNLREGVTGAATCGDKRLVLVSQSGRLLVSDDGGEHFRAAVLEQPSPASAVVCLANDRIVVAGPRGVSVKSFR